MIVNALIYAGWRLRPFFHVTDNVDESLEGSALFTLFLKFSSWTRQTWLCTSSWAHLLLVSGLTFSMHRLSFDFPSARENRLLDQSRGYIINEIIFSVAGNRRLFYVHFLLVNRRWRYTAWWVTFIHQSLVVDAASTYYWITFTREPPQKNPRIDTKGRRHSRPK